MEELFRKSHGVSREVSRCAMQIRILWDQSRTMSFKKILFCKTNKAETRELVRTFLAARWLLFLWSVASLGSPVRCVTGSVLLTESVKRAKGRPFSRRRLPPGPGLTEEPDRGPIVYWGPVDLHMKAAHALL